MGSADLSKKPDEVAAMFDGVAAGYDRTNAILSAGNSALWRIQTTRSINPQVGEKILDIAAGTGTSSAAITKSGAHVVAADFSAGMLAEGKKRQGSNPLITWVQADAMNLPFADNEFDAVTISFGLRNIVDPHVALAEMFRVTKPAGRIVVTEFSHPVNSLFRGGYSLYLRRVMPLFAKLASTNADAYTYLADSIAAWPDQRTLASWVRDAGFRNVAYRNLTGGIVAMHRGVKPL
jgi:demethylmenaquinone methyltransferase/2-methoxy-6-polyprenyl-1,4-benzoquinol methylase